MVLLDLFHTLCYNINKEAYKMKEINKLIHAIDEEINEQIEPMNEMSMAFHYKDRHIAVCAWVENPMIVDNRYFKYYNSQFYDTATKVARIRMNKADYVGGIHKEKGLEKWNLTHREKQYLVKILSSPSEDHKGFNRWQDVIITYNRDNFHLSAEDTIKGKFDKAQCSPNMPKHIKPFPIDYPMPDYLQLP